MFKSFITPPRLNKYYVNFNVVLIYDVVLRISTFTSVVTVLFLILRNLAQRHVCMYVCVLGLLYYDAMLYC